MNRRQFIGASISGLIAALVLPFERFRQWWAKWFHQSIRINGIGANFELGMKLHDGACVLGRISAVDRAKGIVWIDSNGQ